MTCGPRAAGSKQTVSIFREHESQCALCPGSALMALIITMIIKNCPGEHTFAWVSPHSHGGARHFTEEMEAQEGCGPAPASSGL